MIRKVYDLFVLFVFALAVIGGTANLFYFGEPFFGGMVLLLGAMATPYLINTFKDLQS